MSIPRDARDGREPLMALRLCVKSPRRQFVLQFAVACLLMIAAWIAVGPTVGFTAPLTSHAVGGGTSAPYGHLGVAAVREVWLEGTGHGDAVGAPASMRPPVATTTTHVVVSRSVRSTSARVPLVGSVRDRTVDGGSLSALAAGFAAEEGSVLLRPGPFAGRSIPARGPGRDFRAEERQAIDDIMGESGCHTCGTRDPGTVSGYAVPDHQPPNALNPEGWPQDLYPQCLACSRLQGLEIARLLRGPRGD